MDSRELRKLNRKELLEIILAQTRRIETLELELEKAKKELNERKIALKEVGSLAEASLVLSDIFKKADEAANIYISNIKELAIKEEKNTKKELRQLKKKRIEQIEKEISKLKNKASNDINVVNYKGDNIDKRKLNSSKTKRKK